jgi:hypothetical protein
MLKTYKATKPIARRTITERNALRVIPSLPWDIHKEKPCTISLQIEQVPQLSRFPRRRNEIKLTTEF